MKKTNSIISDIIKNGCLIFTIITVITYTLGSVLSSENKAFIPTLKWIFLFLLFSLLLSAANLLLKNKNYSTALRLGLHFIATTALYFVVVVLCGGFIANGSQTLVAMVLYILAYIIFAVIFAISNGTKKKKSNKEEKYDSVFK
ncbi:MAG: DUF3021 family protein [Ruminococcaceae bacterium]|nr:DUF3021 family protein [Oscillospiraceae bacterium]